MSDAKYVIVDPVKGRVSRTEASTRIGAWRAFVSYEGMSERDFNAAIRECLADGFKVDERLNYARANA